MKKLLFLTIFLMTLSNSQSQEIDTNKSVYSLGVHGIGQFNLHSADFKELPGYPSCCPNYQSGSGFGLNFGLLAEHRLTDYMSIGIRAGYEDLSGIISQEESDIFDNNEGTKSNGIIEHTVESDIRAINTNLRLLVELDKSIDVFAGGGISLLQQFQVKQYETLIQPTDVTFENDKIVRNESEGEVNGSSDMVPYINAGIRLNLPLATDDQWEISPTGEFTYFLGNFVENIDWSLSQFKLGLEVRYNHFKEEEIIKKDTVIEEPPPSPKSDIIATIAVTDSIYNTTITDDKKERIIKYQSLLGYIFFDENRAVIPKRYNTEVSKSDISGNSIRSDQDSSLANYYNLLNTVATRLTENPEVKMTIVGCNSNYGLEENNIALSEERMNAVYNYFVNDWGLDSSRFERVARNLPETPSRSDNEFGRAENRRVELIPTDWSILLPKVSKDTKIIKSANVDFTITPTIESNLPVSDWEIVVNDYRNQIESFRGADKPNSEYLITKSFDENSEFNDINFKLSAKDSLGVRDNDSYTFDSNKIKQYLEDLEIVNNQPIRKEFNLILFGYNIANIPPIAELSLNMVKENIDKDSEVLMIEGYSDVIGDESYNLELSKQRALRVAKELNVSSDKAVGMGKVKNTIYNNEYPEGRFYSRSVIVQIGKND